MAWNLHWQVCFASLGGTHYAVNIYEQSYSGDVVQLTGSVSPFSTQEDDDDDYFAPVRVQTGYIRVIDYDGTLLEQLIPQNNVERLVRLYYGTYSNGTFTPSSDADALQWQGFLMADAFTQPIDNNANEIELPVRSVIGALEDVSIDGKWYGQDKNFATIIKTAFDALMVTPAYIYAVSDVTDLFNNVLRMKVNVQVYIDRKEQHNEGTAVAVYAGDSYLSVIQDIMGLFGLQLREHGGDIYMSMYDNVYDNSDVYVTRIPWSSMTTLAVGSLTITTTLGTVSDTPLPSGLQSMGTDNEKSFEPGVNEVKVEVNLGTSDNDIINMPSVDEDDSTVYRVTLYAHDGVLYAQPHPFQAGITSIYRKYRLTEDRRGLYIDTKYEFQYLEQSTYEEVLNNSSLVAGTEKRYVGRGEDTTYEYRVYTGMFPVRWFIRKNSEPVKLRNGLYFVHQFSGRTSGSGGGSVSDETKNAVSFTGAKSLHGQAGFFCIKMNMTRFIYEDNKMYLSGTKCDLLCMFHNGSKYWNGTAWTDSEVTFYLRINGDGTLRTNKTPDMEVEGNDGYFIPFASDSDDDISFVIYDTIRYPNSEYAYETYASIISDVSVAVQYTDDDYTVSSRNSNVYLLTDISTGFRGDKSINLSMGTINNNKPSPSLIKDADGYDVEGVYYNGNDGSPYPALYERPERHLLFRMQRQCGSLRRTVSMQIENVRLAGIDTMAKRYTIDGHAYFGVLSSREWRDDTDIVKFIEVL